MGTVSPSFLLLQARVQGDPMAHHEHVCFADALEVPLEQVVAFDLLSGPPSDDVLRTIDMVLVGGSGSFSTLDDHPWLKAFLDWLGDVVVARSVPTFASCFGFQALVRAGGGRIVKDPQRAEVGTFEITLTEAGHSDPLLGPYAPSFQAQLGHKDRATHLPPCMLHLASSELVPYQAFRIEGSTIFATQFHPELDRAANEYRYRAYRDAYRGSSADDDDGVLQNMRESPEATALLRSWVDEVQALQR